MLPCQVRLSYVRIRKAITSDTLPHFSHFSNLQAGCAAAAGIAMCMSAGICSMGCAAAYSTCQAACATVAFAPTP